MKEFASKLDYLQDLLKAEEIDGWLLFDFRHSNPLALSVLRIPPDKKLTRRLFYWIPRQGEPVKIVSAVEEHVLDHLPGVKRVYRDESDLRREIDALSSAHQRIAMEYSPFNALPTVSKVDAGTVETVRSGGAEVVTSANILQSYTSIWTPEQLDSHRFAAKALDEIAESTWDFIRQSLVDGNEINEYDVRQLMLRLMDEKGCKTDDPPVCAVNAHSADPHFSTTISTAFPIRSGDFILLDLWCKKKVEHAVYADITRVGVAGDRPTPLQKNVFDIVIAARDRASLFVKTQIEKGIPVEGREVDRVCREVIREAGYDEFFVHRTGHSLGEEVHGPGANLDDFETRDHRRLIPGTGFTVEPGIYLPGQFGIRSEYDLYLPLEGGVTITGGIQTELVLLQ